MDEDELKEKGVANVMSDNVFNHNHDHNKILDDMDQSYFSNSSLGIFHVDSSIRRACLAISTPRTKFNEAVHMRKRINAKYPS